MGGIQWFGFVPSMHSLGDGDHMSGISVWCSVRGMDLGTAQEAMIWIYCSVNQK